MSFEYGYFIVSMSLDIQCSKFKLNIFHTDIFLHLLLDCYARVGMNVNMKKKKIAEKKSLVSFISIKMAIFVYHSILNLLWES